MSRLVPASLLAIVSTLLACTEEAIDSAPVADTPVALSAAFTNLDSVDVYTIGGEYLKTIDASTGFQDVLPADSYYMDFIDDDGHSSFMDDGRLAFAPMGQGYMPIDGPYDIDAVSAPLWLVEVNEVLESNAHLTIRAADGDETLRPWKDTFPNWQMNLPEDLRDSTEPDVSGIEKAYSTTTGSSSARLRVTWEASFAMKGKYTSSSTDSTTCNNSTSCWTTSTSSSIVAYWDRDSNGTGYVDYDTSAWSKVMGSYYTSGNGSCSQSGSTASSCYVTVAAMDTSSAKNYTCQSTSGTCTSGNGSTATRPRGGQCKAFENLLLYRSGQYKRNLPSDGIISGSTSKYPVVTTTSIAVGDVLRCPSGKYIHSEIVVAYESSSGTALVVDSNYANPAGGSGYQYEYIAAHTGSFSGSGYADLDYYRDLDCVYGVPDTYDNDGDGNTTETWVCYTP